MFYRIARPTKIKLQRRNLAEKHNPKSTIDMKASGGNVLTAAPAAAFIIDMKSFAS